MDFKFKLIPTKKDKDKRPFRGEKITGNTQPYNNVFLCGPPNVGKTTAIFNFINTCADERTKVIIFSNNVDKDKGWIGIKEECDRMGIEYQAYDSFGANLRNLLADLKKTDEPPPPPVVKKDNGLPMFQGSGMVTALKKTSVITPRIVGTPKAVIGTDGKEQPKEKKYKYRVPDYIIIADDMDLNDKNWIFLLKWHRHFKATTFTSSQYWNDLSKTGRVIIDLLCIFGMIPEDKMKDIYDTIGIATIMSFDTFYGLYRKITDIDHNFMWIKLDTKLRQVRSGFDKGTFNMQKFKDDYDAERAAERLSKAKRTRRKY